MVFLAYLCCNFWSDLQKHLSRSFILKINTGFYYIVVLNYICFTDSAASKNETKKKLLRINLHNLIDCN